MKVEFTDKQVAFLLEVMEGWVPATQSGRVTKAENKLADQIIAKLTTNPPEMKVW